MPARSGGTVPPSSKPFSFHVQSNVWVPGSGSKAGPPTLTQIKFSFEASDEPSISAILRSDKLVPWNWIHSGAISLHRCSQKTCTCMKPYLPHLHMHARMRPHKQHACARSYLYKHLPWPHPRMQCTDEHACVFPTGTQALGGQK
jgi:hypothetical protein